MLSCYHSYSYGGYHFAIRVALRRYLQMIERICNFSGP